jgi:hypothetical protein
MTDDLEKQVDEVLNPMAVWESYRAAVLQLNYEAREALAAGFDKLKDINDDQ